jgi:pSer/pThr/pTyr-binding forkhead associated (FHA) protein
MPGSPSEEAVLKDMLNSSREYRVAPITMIGRGDGAHIRIDSKHVSRKHAKIILGKDGYYLEDLSRNGTLVNGDVLGKGRRLLKQGDVIEIMKHTGAATGTPVFRGRLEIQEAKQQSGFLAGLLGFFGR